MHYEIVCCGIWILFWRLISICNHILSMLHEFLEWGNAFLEWLEQTPKFFMGWPVWDDNNLSDDFPHLWMAPVAKICHLINFSFFFPKMIGRFPPFSENDISKFCKIKSFYFKTHQNFYKLMKPFEI